MGSVGKKEYQSINGIPVIIKSIQAFLQTDLFQSIIITVPTGHCSRVLSLVQSNISATGVQIDIIEGSSTRQESVFKALCALEQARPEIVLIHDAARPWISPQLIQTVFSATETHEACIPVVEIADAPKQITQDGIIEKHIPKHSLKGAQTPQGFRFDMILEAHRTAKSMHSTCADDAEVLSLLGKKVFSIPGEPSNRKITYPHDLEGI